MTWPDIPPGSRPRTKEPAMTVTFGIALIGLAPARVEPAAVR
jgi:hypothetical protein